MGKRAQLCFGRGNDLSCYLPYLRQPGDHSYKSRRPISFASAPFDAFASIGFAGAGHNRNDPQIYPC